MPNEQDLINALERAQDISSLLLENPNIDVNARDEDDMTAVMIATENGDAQAIRMLQKRGANVNAKSQNGLTALMIAAENGDTHVIRVLKELGADVNARNEHGITTLMIAAYNGHKQAIRVLGELGADVNATTQNSLTAIMVAAQEGHLSIIELLVSEGADIRYLLEKPREGVNYETAIAMGQSLFDQKQSGKKEVESKINEIFARSLSLNPNIAPGHYIDEDIMSMIGSFLSIEDSANISQMINPSAAAYKKTTQSLRQYMQEVNNRLESGDLMLPARFQHNLIAAMQARTQPHPSPQNVDVTHVASHEHEGASNESKLGK